MAARTFSAAADGALASVGATWNGGTVLNAGDTVTFDGTSTHTCTWDTSTSIAGVTITSAYTGAVTCSTAVVLTGNFSIAGGTWDNATFAFNANSGAGTLSVTGGTFKGGTATTSTGAVIFNTTGAIQATSGTWNLAGSWTQSGSSTTFTANGGTINITAASTVTDARSTFNLFSINTTNAAVVVASGTIFPLGANPTTTTGTSSLTVNGPSGVLTYSGNWTHTGSITIGSTGTLTANGATPTLSLDRSLTTSGATITNTISTVTFTLTASSVYTDTTDALSNSLFVISGSAAASNFTIAASTKCRFGGNPTITTGSGAALIVTGTAIWSGEMLITRSSGSGISLQTNNTGTLNGANATIRVSGTGGGFTINATTTLTNPISTVTFNGTSSCTYTDTGNAFSATTFYVTINANAAFTVSANTTCNLGLNPTVTCGSLVASGTMTGTGTLSWATIAASTTFTLSSTGTVSGFTAFGVTGSLALNAGGVWPTAAPITATGSIASCTYTDTSSISTGIWTINKTAASVTVAANSTMNLGANPTTSTTTASIVITGTLNYSGLWTQTGNITATGTLTATAAGTVSPSINLDRNLTTTGATITNTITTITFRDGTAGATYTDTSGALANTIFAISRTVGGANLTIAANTSMNIGWSPTTTLAGGFLVVTGTLIVGGNWTHSRGLQVDATGRVTGGLTHLNQGTSLTITAGGVFPTIPITFTMQSTTTITATQTTLGICNFLTTVSTPNATIAANTTVPVGADSSHVLNQITVNGTLSGSGSLTWFHSNAGNIIVGAGGAVTGFTSINLSGNWEVDATATITSGMAMTQTPRAAAGSFHFYGGGKTYGAYQLIVRNSFTSLIYDGSNSFTSFTATDSNQPFTMTFTSATTQTMSGSFSVFNCTMNASTPGSPAFLAGAGTFRAVDVALSDSQIVGNTGAAVQCTDGGGNANWIFSQFSPDGGGGALPEHYETREQRQAKENLRTLRARQMDIDNAEEEKLLGSVLEDLDL